MRKVYRKQLDLQIFSPISEGYLRFIFWREKKQRISRQAGTNHRKGRSYGIKNEGLRECYIYAFTTLLPPNTGSQSNTF